MHRKRALIIAEGLVGGGTFTLNQAVYQLLIRDGAVPIFAYPGTLSPMPINRFQRLRLRLSDLPKIQYGSQHEMDVLTIPVLPGMPPNDLQRRWFAWRIRPLLDQYDELFFSNASVPLVLPLLGKTTPCICWIATTLRDELESQAAGRDVMATRILRSRSLLAREKRERQSLLAASLVLASSDYAAKLVRKVAPEANVRVLPLPIDTDLFCPDYSVIPTTPPILLFAGRFTDRRKNIDLLLNAFAKICSRTTVRLQLVGDQPSQALINRCQELGIEESVDFIGQLPNREDLVNLYRRATLFILPSHQEGYGFVAFEAIASGLPVVSTYCGGPEVLLRESGAGVLAESDPDLFAQAILNLLADEQKRMTIKQAGVEFSRSRLSFQAVSVLFREIRQEVFAKK